ncbi:hypothetical protein A2380_00460 [candidate division WWE3 bacterium RIFOXYB1_FULL_43_24]|uniref:Uncharacterized protein n=2 Tax=Katanobacteria TaxID=422282 RepID=A0A0G0YRE7_UNCKA|nr:MAG: hypothetical protein UU92_C0005G0021 [candidate division WWE3 bacterium GW2011_GWA1_42_12]KKS34835.1 MAG: hypothetical protein UU97_C0005G0001 [candidate division WWE3 bacterium GW2011_GWD1_42_14]KKS39190.1 MAG: hypothetical protein UV00_C0003G0022 [candidate division WWE3 bacterium GW2011_GWF1_42_14]KKS40688.1 MAG: hypothetical protein UV03_C0003G0001 [candidate division WWE3 bacterium GW2011_GWE1_42_16]KKS66843.1 MAG: hypothetical protein UV35_C0006G0022 [candidate division WWE3 bacte
MFEAFSFRSLLRAQGIRLLSIQYTETHAPGANHVCCKPIEYSVADGSFKQIPEETMHEISESLRFRPSKAEVSRLSSTLYVRVPR